MSENSIYKHISSKQALELDVCLRHPALELEELSFVGFVSSSDGDLAELLLRLFRKSIRFPVKEIRDKTSFVEIYQKGKGDTVYVIRCDCFDTEELIQFVYPAMLLYRDYIFDRGLKHFYLGDARFIESATRYLPDLFLVNNVVLQLTNILYLIEKDIVIGESLTGKKLLALDPKKIDLMLWLGQRAFNVGDGTGAITKLTKLLAKKNFYGKSYLHIDLSSVYMTNGDNHNALVYLDKAKSRSAKTKNRSFTQAVSLQEALFNAERRAWALVEKETRLLIEQWIEGDSISTLISAHNLLVYSLIRQHKMEEASQILSIALEVSEKNWNMLARAISYGLRGDINCFRGFYEESQRLYRDSLSFYASRQRLPQIAFVMVRLGCSYKVTGEYYFARKYYQKAYELYRYCHLNYGMAHSMLGLAQVGFCLGQRQVAERKYQQAINLFGKEKSPYDQACSKIYLAECLIEDERYDEAGRLLEEVAIDLKGEYELGIVSRLQGRLRICECAYEEASALLMEALSCFKSVDDKANILPCLVDLGRLKQYQGDFPTSYLYLQEALHQTEIAENIPARMQVYRLLEDTCKKMGEQQKAVKYKTQAQRIQNHLSRLQKLNQQQP